MGNHILPTRPPTTTTTASKPASRKMILVQLISAFLLGFFILCSLGVDSALRTSIANCPSDLCRHQDLETVYQEYVSDKVNPSTTTTTTTTEEKRYPYTIVTASSANHLCSLENFLYSLHQLRPALDPSEFPRIVVYNIGMNRTQLPVLDQLQAHGLIDELVTFDYFRYPRFWDVAIHAGEYGWKTGIVREAAQKYGGVLVWLDAGNLVTADFLRHAPELVRDHGGFWSPRSSYRMSRWTHPGMYAYLNEPHPDDYATNLNCNGAAVGFDTANQTIVDTLIEPWYACGSVKQCIAPAGSSRLNHRQDQAVLTYLAYKHGHKCTLYPSRYYGLQTHRDVSCRSSLIELDLQGQLYHPSSIDFPKWLKSDTLQLYNHPEWRYPEDSVPDHILQSL